MEKPRIYIIAPEQMADGRPITLLNKASYEQIAVRLEREGLEAVYPEHDTEGGDEPTLKSIVLARSAQLETCDIALLVSGWQDCPKARKMQQTALINGMFFHPVMDGYDKLKKRAFSLKGRRA